MQEQDTTVVEETQVEETPVDSNESQGENDVTQEELQALQAELAARAQREQEALAQVEALRAKIDAMEQAARTARFNALAAGWQGETAKHLQVLEALGEGTEAYNAYVSLQNALSEQVEQGALFNETGRNPQQKTGTAYERLESEARRLQTENPALTFEQAFDLATQANPQLLREYREEQE